MKTKVMKLITLLLPVYAMKDSEKIRTSGDSYKKALDTLLTYEGSNVRLFQKPNDSEYYRFGVENAASPKKQNYLNRRDNFIFPEWIKNQISAISARLFPNQNSYEPQYYRHEDGLAINMGGGGRFAFLEAEKSQKDETTYRLLDLDTGEEVTCRYSKEKKMTVDRYGNTDYVCSTAESTEYLTLGNRAVQILDFVKEVQKQLLKGPLSSEMTKVKTNKKCDKCSREFLNGKAVQLKNLDPDMCCNAHLHPECVFDYLKGGKCPHGWFTSWRKGENRTFSPKLSSKMVLIWKNSSLCIYGFITIALMASALYNFYLHHFDSGFTSALHTIRSPPKNMDTGYSCFFTETVVTMISDFFALIASFVVAFWVKKKGIPIDLIERISKKEIYLPLGGGTVAGLTLGIVGLAYGGGPVALFAVPSGLLGGLGFLPWGKIGFNLGIGAWCLSVLFQIITTVIVNTYRFNKV